MKQFSSGWKTDLSSSPPFPIMEPVQEYVTLYPASRERESRFGRGGAITGFGVQSITWEPRRQNHVHASEDLLEGVTPEMIKCRCGCAILKIKKNRERLDAEEVARLQEEEREEIRRSNAVMKLLRERESRDYGAASDW